MQSHPIKQLSPSWPSLLGRTVKAVIYITTMTFIGNAWASDTLTSQGALNTNNSLILGKDAISSHSNGMLVEKLSSRKTVPSRTVSLVATVTLANGATLEFIEVGDGYVGVSEYTSSAAPFATASLVSQWQATPLEIYFAFSAGRTDTPQALVNDHKLRTARASQTGTPPRDLSAAATALLSLGNPGAEEYACDHFGGEWTKDWRDAFEGVTEQSPAAYIHTFTGYTFYPGAPVYYGTGSNRKTYLGACNGRNSENMIMEVHRWAVSRVVYHPTPTPPTVVWDWVKIQEVPIAQYMKFTFYSGHPAGRYRGYVYGEGGSTIEHGGIGAAWTKSLPVGIDF